MLSHFLLLNSRTHRFLKSGGTPAQLIHLLSTNYRGYAQMANLLCDLLVTSGMRVVVQDPAKLRTILERIQACRAVRWKPLRKTVSRT